MSKTVKTMNDLYVESLRDLFSAETQITQALPKLSDAATNEQLKAGIQMHLQQTEEHIARLREIFGDLNVEPGGHHCEAMEGLLAEGDELLETVIDKAVLDAAMIGAAQKVEHYEISGYGTARTFARLLGFDGHADLLQSTLDEEAETDENLTELAESMVNEQAAKSLERSMTTANKS